MQPGDVSEITELPAFVYDKDGEKQPHACTELYLTERVAESIMDKGIIPLVSYRDRNAVRVPRMHSVAEHTPYISLHYP